jgi:hypothetical protein
MTEEKHYITACDWQTQAPTAEQRLAEILSILDGINSPDWPENAQIMIEQILATINEGVSDDPHP